jgi:hypothetical protein
MFLLQQHAQAPNAAFTEDLFGAIAGASVSAGCVNNTPRATWGGEERWRWEGVHLGGAALAF